MIEPEPTIADQMRAVRTRLKMGAALRVARTRAGWTMDVLAGWLGVTRAAVHQWERGITGGLAARTDEIDEVFHARNETAPKWPEEER